MAQQVKGANISIYRTVVWSLALILGWVSTLGATEAVTIERRMLDDVRFLASDELEGRGIETKGLDRAAEYIRDAFRQAGLKSGVPDGSYFQYFSQTLRAKVVPARTHLELKDAAGTTLRLELGKDFQPLSFGGGGKFAAPIVLIGYGISAGKLKYDDYQGIDVAGKVLLMLRKEPQQGDSKSVFDGTEPSEHATFDAKAETAWMHKAAAVLLVNEPFSVKNPAADKLLDVNVRGFSNPVGIPFIQIRQEIANRLLVNTPARDLKHVEAEIDRNLRPMSQPVGSWSANGEVTFERVSARLENVVGVIEGSGPRAQETIVIGAHYDHLGRGGSGSLAPQSKEVHNGADDNASGTAALIELARRFGTAPKPPPRRLVFIGFSGEEEGLLGSRYYVRKQPLFPLASTIAMVNFDMVGRMREDKLILYGVKSAKEFAPVIDRLEKESGLKVKKVATGTGPSDNASFYAENIPSFHFFTDLHKDYHRPSDDVDKINPTGMRQVVDFAYRLVEALLDLPERPTFVKVAGDPHAGLDLPRTSNMAYLGTAPDYSADVVGVLLQDVTPGSPADKGGLKPGDVIVEIAETPIRDVTALTRALRKHKPNETVTIIVERDKKRVPLTVTFGKRGG